MLNQIPYTNVHELNLDWVIRKLKDFEQELSQIEDYDPRITALETIIGQIKASVNEVNKSLLLINERCNDLEDGLEANDQKILDLRELLYREMSSLQAELDSIEGLYMALRAYNDTTNTVIYNDACRYADKLFRDFVQWVSDPRSWLVISPVTHRLESIQDVVDELYTMIAWASITCSQFDQYGFDCEYLDSIGFTCFDFDFYGRYALFFSASYVTESELLEYVKRSELEHYALKTDLDPLATKEDIKIYNPVTGIKGSMQQAINTLVSFHQCGNNCFTLDGLEYTASDLDGLGISAYDFDFKGIIKSCGRYTDPTTGERSELQLILNNIVSLLTMGLTATQYDNLDLDAETFDDLNLDAKTLDFYGLSIMRDLGYITVLTGLTAEQYQDILVGNYGILHTINR